MSIAPDSSQNVVTETILKAETDAVQNTARNQNVPHAQQRNTRRPWRQRLASAFFGTVLGLIIPSFVLAQTATLLPNAKQQYTDDAGASLGSGSVTYYVPSTSTKKTVWLDAAETIPSTNPVLLDAAGRPQPTGQTFGDGQYRQVVKDVNNIVIWDAVTSSTGGGSGPSPGPTVGDGNAVGTILPWAGLVAPPNYLFAFGQAISRTTYPLYTSTVTISVNLICTSGLNVLSGIADTTQIRVGAPVEASCVAPGTTVASVATTSVTVSNNASVSTAVAAKFFPYGNGDGSITLNVPDLRGQTIAGRNNMGGTASTALTTAFFGSQGPNALGSAGGTQSHALLAIENGPHSHDVFFIDPGHTHAGSTVPLQGTTTPSNITSAALDGQNGGSITNLPLSIASASTGARINSASGGGGFNNQTAFSGNGQPIPLIQPTTMLNYVIKVLPDASTTVASGVASIGGMTGVIACGANITCGSQTISASLPVVTTDIVTYIAPFTGAVPESQTAYNATRLAITDFGCIADSGVTDNGPCLRKTYDAAAAIGASIYIPPSSGYYGVSTCRNDGAFDGTSVTVPNGNKSVSIYGAGWNEKPFATPQGSWLLPNTSFPSSCSWIHLSGSDKVSGTTYSNFGIGEFGGALGVPKGLNGLYCDASANPTTFYIQNLKVDHVYIANMATGKSIKATTGTAASTGCFPDSSITNSKFINFHADFLADHFTIDKNTIGQNATVDSRNVGIEFTNCGGCTSTEISNNNISNFNGMVVVNGAIKPNIHNNELEQGAGSTNANGAQIDLNGSVSLIEGASVSGNSFSQNSLVGNYAPVKVANAISTQIYDNRIALATTPAYDYVTVTGAASGTFIGYNRCEFNGPATPDLACTISSLGPNGFQYTFFGFILPGSSTGFATITTQAAAGTPALKWPTGSGTLASAANSPLVLSATTGLLTCPTCATTGGASIPTIAQGDLLFGSAANTLSALAKNTTATRYLANTGASNNPAWDQVNLANGVTGALPNANLTSLAANQLLGALTATTPSGQTVPSCSTAASALLWTSGVGFSCNTSITANTVTTNANLTGAVTSVGNATSLGSFSSANLSGALTDETGSGVAVFGTSPILTTVDARGTWTTGTSWTLPAHTLGGTVSGGGNQINNAIIGTTTPLAGFFTTLSATTSLTSPLHIGGSGTTGTTLTLQTTSGVGTTDQMVINGGNNGATRIATLLGTGLTGFGSAAGAASPSNTIVEISANTAANSGTVTAYTTMLHVTSADSVNGSITSDAFGTGIPAINMRQANGTAASKTATANDAFIFVLNGDGYNGSSYNFGTQITAAASQTWTAGANGTRLAFSTIPNGSTTLGEAMRIQNSGGVSVGTTTDPGIGSLQLNAQQFMPNITTSSAAQTGTVCWTTGTGKFTVDTTVGCLTSIAAAKSITEKLDPSKALDIVSQLDPFAFRYKEGYGDSGQYEQFGLAAEKVAQVDERLVGRDPEGTLQGVRYQEMTAVLAGAIQQLKADNDSLRACNNNWKCRIFGR